MYDNHPHIWYFQLSLKDLTQYRLWWFVCSSSDRWIGSFAFIMCYILCYCSYVDLIFIFNFLYFVYFCFAVCRSSPLLQISNMPSALRCFCTRRKQLSRYWGKRLVANRKGKAPDKTRRLDKIDSGHTIKHFIQCHDSWYYCHDLGGK